MSDECQCYKCTIERVADEPSGYFFEQSGSIIDYRLARMFLCETCGNKRCPHAADHNLACMNSNEPGQKGSRYE